jgi:glycerol-3-phosphate acyltransferase PlsY
VAKATGKAALASLVAVAALVAGVAVVAPGWEVAAMVGLAMVVVARHWSNLVRLVRGTENSLGQGAHPA